LVLGASRAQCPAIFAARRAGHEVLTADNVPDNPGHALADASFVVDASDADACTRLAESRNVDGVAGYASEVCARTAARVAARLGLPGSPVEGVENLSHKSAFRACQEKAGNQCLPWKVFGREDADLAERFARELRGRVVVKPVDNSGGRGVNVLPGDFRSAFANAAAASWLGQVVVEAHVARIGSQMGGDGWVEQGRLVFLDCFDNASLSAPAEAVAIQETFPSRRTGDEMDLLHGALGGCLAAAGYSDGPFNFDACFTENGQPFIFEIAPRNAGNLIPMVLARRTGVDFPDAVVRFSLDRGFRFALPESMPAGASAFHAIRVMAAPADGVFGGIEVSPRLVPRIIDRMDYVSPGQRVRRFQHAGDALGLLVMEFASAEERDKTMAGIDNLMRVIISPIP
jgi:biotin carboxylase